MLARCCACVFDLYVCVCMYCNLYDVYACMVYYDTCIMCMRVCMNDMSVGMYLCMICIYAYKCMYICMICLCVCVCVYVCMYVCICIYVCICMYGL